MLRPTCLTLAAAVAAVALSSAPLTVPAGRTVAAATAPSTSTLDVPNPGLEAPYVPTEDCANVTGVIAQGWSDNTCWNTDRPVIRYDRDTTSPHGGSSSQRVTLVSGPLVQFSNFLPTPTVADATYTVSVWLRSQQPMFLSVGLREQGEPYDGYGSALAATTSAWTRFTFPAVTPGGPVVLLVKSATPGTFWVDDVAITSTPRPATAVLTPTQRVPRTYVGIHRNYVGTPWPAGRGAIGTERIWDAFTNLDGSGVGAQWDDIETAPGVYDWRGLDEKLAQSRAARADTLYTLGGRTPRWASARPDERSPYGPGQAAEPRTDALWEKWVRTIATRYKGRITHWEIWNEPDLTDFYTGTPATLVRLSGIAYRTLKSVDPANVVVSPGFSGLDGPGYLDYYLALGGGRWLDVVGYHNYVAAPEDALEWRMGSLRAVLARHGVDGRPLWNTEQGWGEVPVARQFPDRLGASLVSRALLVNWALGFSRFYLYSWDGKYSNIRYFGAGGRLTLAGVAYENVATWLIGRTMTSLVRHRDGTYVATLRSPSGSISRALWNPAGARRFALPATWCVGLVRGVDGRTSPLPRSRGLAVSELPVLVTPPCRRLTVGER